MSVDLKKRVPSIIKSQEIWKDFLDVISDELQNIKTQVEKKDYYLDIDQYTSAAQLIYLARSLGYSPNLVLDTSLDFVKEEVESIVYKIKNKAIYNYYNYLFKLIPYSGNVYVLFKDYLKLIRAVDITSVYALLNEHDLTQPFTDFSATPHFDEYRDQEIALDADPLFYLDALVEWFLDQDIVVKPTNHLAIEYAVNKLLTSEGTEYLMTADYFKYLEAGVAYGRKTTDVPHIGAQVSMFMAENGYFDSFTNGEEYSIPDLKLKCSITDFYKDEDSRSLVSLDDTDLELDEQVTWYLDQDEFVSVSKTINELFDKVVVGTGTKGLFSIEHKELVNDLLLHCSFENPDTTTMVDHSPSDYDIEIQGDFTLINGSSGKAVRFNGINTQGYIEELLMSDTNKTFCFWIKADSFGQLTGNPRLLYQNSSFNFYYDVNSKQLKFTIIGTLLSKTITHNIDIKNKELFIIVELDQDNNKLSLYIDGKVKQTIDTSTIGAFSSDKPLYIGSSGNNDYFRGYIDELRIYDKVLSDSDKLYLYTQKLGSLQYLANKFYEQELSTNEFNEGSNFKSIFCSIPANTTNKEVVATGDGTTNTFTGYFNRNNIIPGFLELTYYSFPDFYTVTGNMRGELEGDRAEGTVDYETGEFSLTTYKVNSELREIIEEDKSVTEVDYTTDNQNLKPGTVNLNFWINETNYNIIDDGSGNLSGTGISGTGSVNYNNGTIQCTFSQATDANKDVYVAYDYTGYSTPDSNTDITAEYTVNNNIEITEAGVEDVNGDLTIYSTFPPTQFNSRYNHLSLQFFIRKQ